MILNQNPKVIFEVIGPPRSETLTMRRSSQREEIRHNLAEKIKEHPQRKVKIEAFYHNDLKAMEIFSEAEEWIAHTPSDSESFWKIQPALKKTHFDNLKVLTLASIAVSIEQIHRMDAPKLATLAFSTSFI